MSDQIEKKTDELEAVILTFIGTHKKLFGSIFIFDDTVSTPFMT